MSGFIKLHRGWRDSEFFGNEPYCERAAWVWLIETAAWKDMSRRAAKGQIISVSRGQLHTSHNSLAKAWGWSAKRARGFIDRLEKAQMLGVVADANGTLITICNYEKYQADGRSQGADEGAVRAQSGRTQEEEIRNKEEKNKGGYAFSGRVIRLNRADLERWSSAFPTLDVPALLQSRDDWFSTQGAEIQKRWFNSTSNWLAKMQQEAKANAQQAENRKYVVGP